MEKKKTTIKTKEPKKEEKMKLNSLIWELPFNKDLVAQVLFVYFSNERKGSAKQKSKGEVAGGGRKPWKQKGTGRARHGSIRSPLWIGGGVTFATHDRNFSKKINKKMVKKATAVMLSERLRKSELEFVKLTPAQAKKLRAGTEKGTLVISDNNDTALILRNKQKINTVSPTKVNAKHLVSARKVLVDNGAIKILEERLLNEK